MNERTKCPYDMRDHPPGYINMGRRTWSYRCGYARALTGKKPTEKNPAYRAGYAAGQSDREKETDHG